MIIDEGAGGIGSGRGTRLILEDDALFIVFWDLNGIVEEDDKAVLF